MTRDEAKQLLPVIQAWAEGKEVQYRDSNIGHWKDADMGLTFSRGAEFYRIKPTPKYRPFKNAKECWAEMQKHQPFGWVKDQNGYINLGFVNDDGVGGGSFEKDMEHLNFVDGQPFGILEEEE